MSSPPPQTHTFLKRRFLAHFKKYTHTPPQVTTCLHTKAKVVESAEKCQNPESWQVMNVPERYPGSQRSRRWTAQRGMPQHRRLGCPLCTPKLHCLGKDFVQSVPAPAWEGRQGAEEGLMSSRTIVPLSRSKNDLSPAVRHPNRLPPSRSFSEPALFTPPPNPPIHEWRSPSSKGEHGRVRTVVQL